MGIRYYGWAVSTDETTRAFDDPWSVIADADRRHGTTDWAGVGLDKAWRLLQGLFRPPGHVEPRVGYALLAGDVTYPYGYSSGYEPHIGVLPPELVRLVARDVNSVSAVELRSYSAGLCYDNEQDRRGELDYLNHHLRAAQTFTADAASRGHGIVYTIG